MPCNREEEKMFIKIDTFLLLNFWEVLMMLENKFQAELIKELKVRFKGCIVLKNDPNYIQGIPDLIVLYNNKWAALECKKSERASHQPNQEYYVDRMNQMSFASFIYPENKEEVLHELQSAFGSRRTTRLSRCK